jgi:hypothetical protein
LLRWLRLEMCPKSWRLGPRARQGRIDNTESRSEEHRTDRDPEANRRPCDIPDRPRSDEGGSDSGSRCDPGPATPPKSLDAGNRAPLAAPSSWKRDLAPKISYRKTVLLAPAETLAEESFQPRPRLDQERLFGSKIDPLSPFRVTVSHREERTLDLLKEAAAGTHRRRRILPSRSSSQSCRREKSEDDQHSDVRPNAETRSTTPFRRLHCNDRHGRGEPSLIRRVRQGVPYHDMGRFRVDGTIRGRCAPVC